MHHLMVLLLSVVLFSKADSQTFSNHGLVSVHGDGLLAVKGDVQNNANGLIDNDGLIDLNGEWIHLASN